MGRRTDDDTVYLLHFDRPIGNTASRTGYAQHYTGSTPDLARRLARHQAGSDAKIMVAVQQAGIGWQLARTWPGGRVRERQIKVQGGARRHCPVCHGKPPAVEAGAEFCSPARRAEPSCIVTAPQPRPAPPDPPPLWEFIVSHLEPAEATALLGELDKAEKAAWDAATPDAGAEYGSRFDAACELSRLRSDEASAAGRLAEARAIAEAEGWGRRELTARVPDRELEAG